ncbi:hypothetical protein N866_10370 [Actinotalea ferrariae CF5-4]|uniref:Uncharacterized protein n=2 Tax=Actinotalea TaxID=458839 RepID=A0A021VMC7_9CELL|nr:hypothetical protein N866_10370 [Actinotalea ferrariae CF5-4]
MMRPLEPLTPRTVLDTIADAQALWTYRSGTLDYDDHLSAFDAVTTQLERALSRLQVLTTTHPDLTLAGAIPPGAAPDDEVQEWQDSATFLRDLVETHPGDRPSPSQTASHGGSLARHRLQAPG